MYIVDEKIFGHKIIFSAWSSFFSAMFQTEMQEKMTGKVILDDIEIENMLLLCKFLYGVSVDVNFDSCVQLMKLAHRFEIKQLMVFCAEYFQEKISKENCCQYMVQVDSIGCMELGASLFSFVLKNLGAISPANIALLSSNLMSEIIRCSDLNISEELLFEIFIGWLESNPLFQNEEYLSSILPFIRFPLMSVDFLVHRVEQSPIMNCSVASILLLEAYRYHCTKTTNFLQSSKLIDAADGRMQERGREIVIFGEESGDIVSSSSTMSTSHPISHMKRKDDKYWLPADSDSANVSIRFDSCYRLYSIRFMNRHSLNFSFMIKRSEREEWSEVISGSSGQHKEIKEIFLTKANGFEPSAVTGCLFQVCLFGKAHPNCHTSIYWLEITGKPSL